MAAVDMPPEQVAFPAQPPSADSAGGGGMGGVDQLTSGMANMNIGGGNMGNMNMQPDQRPPLN